MLPSRSSFVAHYSEPNYFDCVSEWASVRLWKAVEYSSIKLMIVCSCVHPYCNLYWKIAHHSQASEALLRPV